MKATLIHGARDIRLEEVSDPGIRAETDAIVRVVAACVCGSDLWPYRGIAPISEPRRIGHEFVGTVEEVGSAVTNVRVGDFVIAPFYYCDNTCVNCR
ncbi:MAG: alcohol dehydrogenase catalytic domain-containing protein, partial [Terrimesophilobacter sp.]